jgi:ribonuclease HI
MIKTVPTSIATHVIWFTWLERNKAIFEDTSPSLHSVIYKTLARLTNSSSHVKSRLPRTIMINHSLNTTLAWFDGAASKDVFRSGAGGVIKIWETTVYKWTFFCGKGTNTRAELLGAWVTLMLAEFLEIPCIHIMGDSKVVIDWLSDKGGLMVSSIEGWKKRIKLLIQNFLSIEFQHIYRDFNTDADNLSKQALIEPEGLVTYYQWTNGDEGPRRQIKIH